MRSTASGSVVTDDDVRAMLPRVPFDMTEDERWSAAHMLALDAALDAAMSADERADFYGDPNGPAPFGDPTLGDEAVLGDEHLTTEPVPTEPVAIVRTAFEHIEQVTALQRRVRAQQWLAIAQGIDAAAAHAQIFTATGSLTTSEAFGIAMRSAGMDLAARLGISDAEVHAIASDARRVETRLPRLWSAFAEGLVDDRNVRTAAAVIGTIPPLRDEAAAAELDRRLDATLSVLAQQLSVGRFRRRAKELRERLHPEAADVRHARAVEQREFRVDYLDDGMAQVNLLTDAVSAAKIERRVQGMTRVLADAPDETRTFPQRRADLARDLLTDGEVAPIAASDDHPGRTGTPRVDVQLVLTIPVLELLEHRPDGVTAQRPVLEGVGPISMPLARRLAGEASSFRRVLTDPWTGSVLDAESHTRRLTRDMEWWIAYRDKTCRAPGCTKPATQCDIDHTIAWIDDGPSTPINLGPLHRGHHTVKHHGNWSFEQVSPGVFRWISPTGRATIVYPDDALPFALHLPLSPQAQPVARQAPPVAPQAPPIAQQTPPVTQRPPDAPRPPTRR